MENCEKCSNSAQKSINWSAQECWKCKIVLQIRKSAKKVPSAIGTGLIAKVCTALNVMAHHSVTVEPCFKDTRLIQTHVSMDSIHGRTPYMLNKDTA